MPRKPKGRKTGGKKGVRGKVVPDLKVAEALSGRNPARIAYAEVTISKHSYSITRAKIMTRFKVASATAERDIRDAQLAISEAAKQERPYLLARETNRLTRIADKSEDISKFQEAIAASREIGKMNGIYAAKKVEHSGTIGVAVEMRAVMAVLDAKGLAALDIVLEQVERAKANGLLARPAVPVALDDDDKD